MSVNGVTGDKNTVDSYGSYKNTKSAAKETKAENTASQSEAGAVYEKTSDTAEKTDKKYKPNTELINKMKADADAKTEQMRSLVEQLMTKQGNAYGSANDMWKFLASGKFTVDAKTKAQAQTDISEDGYWGVNQTSDRILDFAKALSGGDPKKMEEMRSAFEKGFKAATSAWGKELPSISKDTYSAVMDKFDQFSKDSEGTTN